MYYEERIVNDILQCRSTPNGRWEPVTGERAELVNRLIAMQVADRFSVVRFFCDTCGAVVEDGFTCPCRY